MCTEDSDVKKNDSMKSNPDLLDSLVPQLREALLSSLKLPSDDSSLIEFLNKPDTKYRFKISIEISIPQKIKEGQILIQKNQFQPEGVCYDWIPGRGPIQVPCNDD
jgi:hypothetical protein